MKKLLYIFFVLFLGMFWCGQNLYAQQNEVPSELVKAFKTANADAVSKYFNNNVDMTVPSAENLYTKAQAKGILVDFFRRNQVKDFIVVHKGTKENAAFLIGNQITANGSFRVSIFTRKSGNKLLVYQLRIEKAE